MLLLVQLAVVSSGNHLDEIESTIQRVGVRHVNMLNITDAAGITTFDAFMSGLTTGAKLAPVVMSNLGPVSEEICNLMAHLPKTAFVMTAGNEAIELDFSASSTCWSKNILFVGTTNRPSNWGKAVRFRVEASNSTEAVALVAGRLSLLADNENLEGAELINNFLK